MQEVDDEIEYLWREAKTGIRHRGSTAVPGEAVLSSSCLASWLKVFFVVPLDWGSGIGN
jgi:hypothetical protein